MRDNNGISRGFGFVCFSNSEEATAAVTQMNSHLLAGKPVYVALHQRKDIRKAQLEAQFAIRTLPVPGGGLPNIYNPALYFPGMTLPGQARPAGQPFVYQPNTGRAGPVNPTTFVPRPRGGAVAGAPMGYPPAMYQQQLPGRSVAPAGVGMPARGGMGGGIRGGRGGAQAPPQVAGGRGQLQKRFQYTPQVPGGMQQQPIQQPQAPPQAQTNGLVPLTAAALASADPSMQRQMLGERLFPLVQAIQPKLAAKITGMFLEIESSELLLLLSEPDLLRTKVDEAVQVLVQAGGPEGGKQE